MSTFLEKIESGAILVADGAMGTMLFERGLEQGKCPEALNISNSDILQEIAELYMEAGADIIQTNTFGGSPMKLADYGLEDKTEKINEKAVEAVRKAVGKDAYISGSCGPSGKLLQPYGEAEPERLYKGFYRQIKALIEAGVDIICVETMTDIQESVLAVTAAKEISNDVPVMSTMTFDETPKGFFTIMGSSVQDVVKALKQAGAQVLGSNCGIGIEKMIRIAVEFRRSSTLPILIQANAGIPDMKDEKLIYPETPDFFAQKTVNLIEAGVNIIGGCCGTTPQHIRAIRNVVDARSS
jgi:5-methyltetrahydrofolate--homocysteine methyltransferase